MEIEVQRVTQEEIPKIHCLSEFLYFVEPRIDLLLRHPIYHRVTDVASLRTFMELHVFAVWDFMSLLKTLQRRLTTVSVPWVPPTNSEAARLVNEIVLSEETDEVEQGKYLSHFELYLAAMDEVGACTIAIKNFIEKLKLCSDPHLALDAAVVPRPAADFVRLTLALTHTKTHQVAAAFLFGREEIIPSMFRQLLARLKASGIECQSFQCYLNRHIEVDEGQHAPAGRKLLTNLCSDDTVKWREAFQTTCSAIALRTNFWNSIADMLVPSSLHLDNCSLLRLKY